MLQPKQSPGVNGPGARTSIAQRALKTALLCSVFALPQLMIEHASAAGLPPKEGSSLVGSDSDEKCTFWTGLGSNVSFYLSDSNGAPLPMRQWGTYADREQIANFVDTLRGLRWLTSPLGIQFAQDWLPTPEGQKWVDNHFKYMTELPAGGVEYVKICSLYGDGFYYIPGTDTCIKLSGYVRAAQTFTDYDTVRSYVQSDTAPEDGLKKIADIGKTATSKAQQDPSGPIDPDAVIPPDLLQWLERAFEQPTDGRISKYTDEPPKLLPNQSSPGLTAAQIPPAAATLPYDQGTYLNTPGGRLLYVPSTPIGRAKVAIWNPDIERWGWFFWSEQSAQGSDAKPTQQTQKPSTSGGAKTAEMQKPSTSGGAKTAEKLPAAPARWVDLDGKPVEVGPNGARISFFDPNSALNPNTRKSYVKNKDGVWKDKDSGQTVPVIPINSKIDPGNPNRAIHEFLGPTYILGIVSGAAAAQVKFHIFVKYSVTGGQSAPPAKGENVKLLPKGPEPGLPKKDGVRTKEEEDDGVGQNAPRGKTDDKGHAEITVSASEASNYIGDKRGWDWKVGTNYNLAGAFEVQNNGSFFAKVPAGAPVVDRIGETLTGVKYSFATFSIGDTNFLSVGYAADGNASYSKDEIRENITKGVQKILGENFTVVFRENTCDIELPGPWFDEAAEASTTREGGIPEATIALHPLPGGGGGAR